MFTLLWHAGDSRICKMMHLQKVDHVINTYTMESCKGYGDCNLDSTNIWYSTLKYVTIAILICNKHHLDSYED